MMLEQSLKLLRAIYRDQHDGYLTLTAIHPNKTTRTPSRHLAIHDKNGIYRALKALFQSNALGWGAYFSVALRKAPLGRWQRGTQSDLLTTSALYVDLDTDLNTSFDRIQLACRGGVPPASAMIGSGRGLHLYWFVASTHDFARVNLILSGLAHTLGGDETSATQALRLPGSHNTKVGVQRKCNLLWVSQKRYYTLDDFAPVASSCPTPSFAPSKRVRSPPDKLNPTLVDAVVQCLVEDYGGVPQKNGWLGALCPLGHSRDKPGKHFAFLPDKGIAHCFGRHGRLLLLDLCTHLTLNPAHYGGLYRK